MRILLTGADGFIGTNLRCMLLERDGYEVIPVVRSTSDSALREMISNADSVVHLAGVNRPQDPAEYMEGNAGFTQLLCCLLIEDGRRLPIAFASSIQASHGNLYGKSKRLAEVYICDYAEQTGAPVAIYRLPNVFGKWCRPNYNSAVATFCHNIAREIPVQINDPAAELRLVYIDDVVKSLATFLNSPGNGTLYVDVSPVYLSTVGDLVSQIRAFRSSRDNLMTERVGQGLTRALYATYVSYLSPDAFSYPVPKHGDQRGVFVEMLKTIDSGQFSFFTSHPGVTRGAHYHHSKTEKFLVIKGRARFRFRHILTGETHILETDGRDAMVVETVPGWAHEVSNIGSEELVVMLWANEVFDHQYHDTIACSV